MGISLLPWDYGIRNLFRRPLRTALTLFALTLVCLLVLVVLGFVRGLDRSLSSGGDPRTAYVFSLGMGENLEYSSIPLSTADLVAASVPGIEERYGRKYASPELYLGTQVRLSEQDPPAMGLVRGVTQAALLVHQQFDLVSGQWPGPGEVLAGRLASAKLGAEGRRLQPGGSVFLEGRAWRISGVFSLGGGTHESEIWCRLDDLQQALKRQDLSLVAVRLAPSGRFQDVDLFCKERIDLELQAIRQSDYVRYLQKGYAPVRWLAWFVVVLIASAGLLVGINTMYGAVVGRFRELATLQTVGFSRRAIVLSLLQEGTVLSIAGALVATAIAMLLVRGAAVRFTMSAFEMQVDGPVVLAGYLTALALGVLGVIPPAIRILQQSVVDSLKAL